MVMYIVYCRQGFLAIRWCPSVKRACESHAIQKRQKSLCQRFEQHLPLSGRLLLQLLLPLLRLCLLPFRLLCQLRPELVNERIGDPPSLCRLDRVLRNAQSHPLRKSLLYDIQENRSINRSQVGNLNIPLIKLNIESVLRSNSSNMICCQVKTLSWGCPG